MRTIERTGSFKRDYKREVRGQQRHIVLTDLVAVIAALPGDTALAPRLRDHALSGDWSGYRDCHVRPDLVLIYQKIGADTLQLVRLASHAELGW